MLVAMGRGHDAEAVTRAAATAIEAGFMPSVDFIFGLPEETDADRAATRGQIARLARMGARIHAHRFEPLPGTPWQAEPRVEVDLETAALLARLGESGHLSGTEKVHITAANRQ